MKTFSVILFLSLFSATLFAQKLNTSQLPGPVSRAFRLKFPEGSQESWAKLGADMYEAVFFNGKKRQSAKFDATGKWLETQTEITKVPGAVNKALMKHFEGFQLQEIYEVQSEALGTTYEMSVFKGKENYYVTISEKGDVLKKEGGEEEHEHEH